MSDDIFAGVAEINDDTPETAEAVMDTVTDVPDDIDFGDDDFWADDDTMTAADYEPVVYRPFVVPAANSWVPVRITISDITTTQRNIVVRNPETGEEEVREQKTIPQFAIHAELACDIYGQKNNDYRTWAPARAVKMAFRDGLPNKRGELGWVNNHGKSLIAATRALKPGEKITKENLRQVADAMVGKLAMARIKHTHSDRTVYSDVMDGNQPVKVHADQHGTKIMLTKQDDKFVLPGGEIYDGEEDLLYEFEGVYYVRSLDHDAPKLQRENIEKRTFDNLNEGLMPIPGANIEKGALTDDIKKRFTYHENNNGTFMVERLAVIERTDGSIANGEITLDTLGEAYDKMSKPGKMIQVKISGEEDLVTARWMGTQWVETKEQYVLSVYGEDHEKKGELFFMPKNPPAPASSGLDVFAKKNNFQGDN